MAADIDDLKNVVAHTLEAKGVLGKIKVRLMKHEWLSKQLEIDSLLQTMHIIRHN
jgi:hypothetical protein